MRDRLHRAWKWGAGTLSACAALASILSSVHGFNGADRVRWIGITPLTDSAFSLGDTLQLASTMTDAHGERLSGIPAAWRSTDSSVASVDSGGSVIARAPGVATIVLAAGNRIAQARVVVSPRAAAVVIVSDDSAMRLPEGAEHRLIAHVVDARGNAMPQVSVAWRVQDPAVAAVDSSATLHGLASGHTTVTAAGAERSASLPLEVYPVAGSITLLAGDGQRAPAGQRLAQPVRAQVVSRSGRPMTGVPVHFLAGDGAGAAGRVLPETDTTDALGTVRAEWTLAPVPGRQRLAIGVDGLATPTLAAAEADPVPANTRVTWLDSALATTVGDTLPVPVTIRVTDSLGLPLPDVPLSWRTDAGVVEGLEARTDSAGEAHARWRLGERAGLQRAWAQVGGPRALPRFPLTTRVLPGAPAAVSVVGTMVRSGMAGTELRPAPVFWVSDRAGNGIPGVALRLRASAGTLPDTLAITDRSGRATVTWVLGTVAGEATLRADVAAVDSSATLAARVRPAPVAALSFAAVPATAAAGRLLGSSIRLQASDRYGNAVEGVTVRLTPSAGKVEPSVATTDARGQVGLRWTLGSKTGPQTLVAEAKPARVRASASLKAVSARRAP